MVSNELAKLYEDAKEQKRILDSNPENPSKVAAQNLAVLQSQIRQKEIEEGIRKPNGKLAKGKDD